MRIFKLCGIFLSLYCQPVRASTTTCIQALTIANKWTYRNTFKFHIVTCKFAVSSAPTSSIIAIFKIWKQFFKLSTIHNLSDSRLLYSMNVHMYSHYFFVLVLTACPRRKKYAQGRGGRLNLTLFKAIAWENWRKKTGIVFGHYVLMAKLYQKRMVVQKIYNLHKVNLASPSPTL